MSKPTAKNRQASAPPAEEQPQAAPQPQVAAVSHTVSHMLGEITWLLTQSPAHRHFALADLEWMVMPALLLQQYRLFHDGGRPIGAAIWGFLSPEAEAKLLLMPPRLRPDEWKSGDRCWLVDLVAPFATAENQMVARMLTDLTQTVLAGKDFNFHRVDPATGKKEAMQLKARSAAAQTS